MAKLDIAFQGRNDAASLATKQAAVNALINEYTSAAVKAASATEKLQEQMQKLLERSTDAGAGMQAFLIQLRIDASEKARFVYDALTSATKGAESTAADSLIKIIESSQESAPEADSRTARRCGRATSEAWRRWPLSTACKSCWRRSPAGWRRCWASPARSGQGCSLDRQHASLCSNSRPQLPPRPESAGRGRRRLAGPDSRARAAAQVRARARPTSPTWIRLCRRRQCESWRKFYFGRSRRGTRGPGTRRSARHSAGVHHRRRVVNHNNYDHARRGGDRRSVAQGGGGSK